MVPFLVLVLSFVILRGVGFVGVQALDNVDLPLRIALFLMFLVAASAHWGKGRPDLVRMVPPVFPRPEFLVNLTGVLEILGAFGLLVPVTSRFAALGLTVLLLAVFPANVRAAREHLTILGRPVPGLLVRTVIQLVFIFALLAVALHESLHPLLRL